jgi:cobalt-zinc-cadmium efflux system membrane fusion protein
MKPNRKYIAMMLAFSLAICSCKNSSEDKNVAVEEEHHDHEDDQSVSLTAAQMTTAGVELGKVERRQIAGTIKVNGHLDVPPQQLVSISVPLGGFLKTTSLLQGSTVRKGQVIAVIENLDFIQIQQDYLEAKNHFELSSSDYQRQQELAKENVNSQKTLQQSKATFFTWQAKYSALREKLRMLSLDPESIEKGNIRSSINLYSPINGFVTEVNVNIGKFVNPTDVIIELVDTSNLHAELIIFEKDVPKIKPGQAIRFTLANETEERMGKVDLVGREIGANRTVQIHCSIDHPDKDLLPGMYLSAVVETGSQPVISLPTDAVVDHQGTKYIFVAGKERTHEHERVEHGEEGDDHSHGQEHSFEMVAVNVGNSAAGFTELVDADSISNLRVVVKGAYALLSKMKNSEEEGGHHH